MVKKKLLILFIVVLSLASCGSFSYRWYGLDLLSYEKGKLLGPEEKDDLHIKVCEPDDQNKGKCVVLLTSEFERLKADMIELRTRLEACEKE